VVATPKRRLWTSAFANTANSPSLSLAGAISDVAITSRTAGGLLNKKHKGRVPAHTGDRTQGSTPPESPNMPC